MQVTDEMVRAARRKAPKFWRDYDGSEEQMRQCLTAALAAMWQPIETAPRDGTRILLYTDELAPPTIQAQWRPFEAFFAGAGEWVDVWNNDPIETNTGPICPTHWAKVLPAPSQLSKRGDAERDSIQEA